MVLPGFIQREVAPRHHTHSIGNVTGGGGGAAAERGMFISVRDPIEAAGGGNTTQSIRVYFEIRDGASSRVSAHYAFRVFTDDATPVVKPDVTFVSSYSMVAGDHWDSVAAAATQKETNMFIGTTKAGSAVVRYMESNALTRYVGVVFGNKVYSGNQGLVFTGT